MGDGKSNKYKVEKIWNIVFYAKKLENDHLLELYYLILWKNYLKEKKF